MTRDNWNLGSLRDFYLGWLIDEGDLHYTLDDLEGMEKQDLIDELTKKAMDLYEENESILPEETMREMERVYLLKNVDTYWMDHIDAMEQLKQGIRLRAYGQRDPVVEYRFEGFNMFDEMIASIREDTVKMVLAAPKRIVEIQKRTAEIARKQQEMAKQAAAAHQVVLPGQPPQLTKPTI